MTAETRHAPGDGTPLAVVRTVEWIPDKNVLRVVADVARIDRHIHMVGPMVGQLIWLLPARVPTGTDTNAGGVAQCLPAS